MTDLEEKEKIINTLLLLIPNAFELKWDQATLWEHHANEKLLQLCYDEAMTLYRRAIQEKKTLLNHFEKDQEQWDKKRYFLAQSCVTYAKVCTNLEFYDEAQSLLTYIFELLNKNNFSAEYQRRVLVLLINGYRTMVDILTSLVDALPSVISKE